MSLHCPATLVVAREWDDPRTLTDGLRDGRLAAVYTGSRRPAVAAGRQVSDALGATLRTLPELDRVRSARAGSQREPKEGPASAEEILVRYADALGAAADLHRGETVVLLVPEPREASWSPLRVEVGDDGVRIGPSLERGAGVPRRG